MTRPTPAAQAVAFPHIETPTEITVTVSTTLAALAALFPQVEVNTCRIGTCDDGLFLAAITPIAAGKESMAYQRPDDLVAIIVRMPRSMREQLANAAVVSDRSTASLMRLLAREYLANTTGGTR